MSGPAKPDRAYYSTMDASRKRKRTDEAEVKVEVNGTNQKKSNSVEDDSIHADKTSRKQRPPHSLSRVPRYKSRFQARNNSTDQEEENGATKKNRKSKRDRKENPSSRIHSLKKLLSRGTLPPPVQAEKERELETLLFERERKELKKTSKRNLERYHFVRFLERQKAQKALKRLQKLKASNQHVGSADDSNNDTRNRQNQLDEQIKEAETNYNYAIYAPLSEKYISIFADQSSKEGEEEEVSTERQEPDQPKEPSQTSKPPIWYEVQAAMAKGQTELEKIRDRQPTTTSTTTTALKARKTDTGNATKTKDKTKSKPNEKNDARTVKGNGNFGRGGDDERFSRLYTQRQRQQQRRQQGSYRDDDDTIPNESGNVNEQDDSDDDMSDGAGGFFEKR